MADESPGQFQLLMDRGLALGNSVDRWLRRALHVKVGNTEAEAVFVEVVPSDALPWTKFELTIPPSSTTVIDTNLLTSFSRIDYILNFKDNPITVTRSFKMVVQNDAGNVTDSISERMGGSINIQANATDDGIDQFLEITNNEIFALDVTYLKAKI